MVDLKVQVGQLIREARKAKGLTQKEVGKIIGVSESSFNRYENGKANLSLETVEKVVRAIGVEIKIAIV